MSTRPDRDRSISAWLVSEAPDRAPERLLDASRDRLRTTRQRRAGEPAWRIPEMITTARLAIGLAALVAMLTIVGVSLMAVGTNDRLATTPPPLPPAVQPATASAVIPSPVPSRVPSAVQSPTASAVIPSPVPSPEPSASLGFGGGDVPSAGPVVPGRYQTVGTSRLTFEVDATDWQASLGTLRGPVDGQRIRLGGVPGWVGIEVCNDSARRSVDPTVAEVVEAILAIPGIWVTRPVASTVGGYPATYLEVGPFVDCRAVDAPTSGMFLWGEETDHGPGYGPDSRILLWIVDVKGTPWMIQADLVPSDGPAFEDAVRRLVGTVEFE